MTVTEAVKEFKSCPKVICMMTYLRAGSKLFYSFVDWHPQIISFPRTMRFNKYWKEVSARTADPEFLVDTFINMYPRFFSGKEWYRFNKYDRADQLGSGMDETFTVDKALFRKYALEALGGSPADRRELFICLHIAYHFACGREYRRGSAVFYHIHDIIHIDDLGACLEDFPGAKLIVTTRHPVEGINSCVKWMLMHNTLSCAELYTHQHQALAGTDPIMEKFPSLEVRVLTYERQHKNHREVMDRFVKMASIDWDESLMRSTLHGKLWWSNGKAQRNGADPNISVYAPKGFLEKKDMRVLASLAQHRAARFGYLPEEDKAMSVRIAEILLPTAAEWTVLRTCFNPSFWIRVARKVGEELSDNRIKGYDYYTKKKGKRLRAYRQFLKHAYRINVLSWLRYYFKRVALYISYRKNGDGKESRLPEML